jgi:hypothetical protein
MGATSLEKVTSAFAFEDANAWALNSPDAPRHRKVRRSIVALDPNFLP